MTYDLALSLARPVARGWLSLTAAHAHMMASALSDERAGKGDAARRYRFARHVFDQQLAEARTKLAIEAMHQRWEARHGR